MTPRRRSQWTDRQAMLYIALVPIVAVVGSLGVMSILRSEGSGAITPAAASATQASTALEVARERGRAARRQYNECMKALGADFNRPQLRGRFSRFSRPDMSKIRAASATCQSLLQGGQAPAPPPAVQPSAPPVA